MAKSDRSTSNRAKTSANGSQRAAGDAELRDLIARVLAEGCAPGAIGKRTVLYGRTSLDRSDGRSVDDQLRELIRWAIAEKRRVIAVLRDDGISASRFAREKERPGWRETLDLIDRRATDELALWETSRGSRDLAEWVVLVDAGGERSVDVAVRGRVFDPTDPEDRRRLLYDAVDAEAESGRTSQRVARAARSRAASGRPHGPLNYGYMIEYDPATGKASGRVPNPQTAPYVVEAIDRLLAGEPAGEIVRDFIEREVPTLRGGKWNQANLVAMVRKPVYAGIRASEAYELPEDHKGTWAALIDEGTHNRLIAMLDDPTRRTVRNGSHQQYLLPGVGECGRCVVGRMRTVPRTNRSGTERTVRYGCRECKRVVRRADPVDEYVSGVVVKFLSRPDVMEMLADPGDTDRAEARAESARLSRKLAEIEAQMDADELDVAAGTRLMKSTRDKLERVDAAARPRHVPSVVLNVAGPEAAARWEATPVHQRRAIIRALFTVTIDPSPARGAGRVFDPSLIRIERRLRR